MKELIRKLYQRIELFRYNEYTSENLRRKKGYNVGSNNRFYSCDFGSEPYLIKIGNHCTITSGVKFITHDGGAWVFRKELPNLNVFNKIEIKDNCFIGVNAIILPGVTIGPNSVVGAGAVVTKNVLANTVVAGVPAKVTSSLEEYKSKCIENWEKLNLKGPHNAWEKQLKNYFWRTNK